VTIIKKPPLPAKVRWFKKRKNNMSKVSNRSHFIKSFTHLLTGKLTAREVLIYGIVHQFEANNTPCFISRQELARRINESEATAERSLQLLITGGHIIARRQGKKRYLSTGSPQASDLYQLDTDKTVDLYQNDTQSVSKQGVDLYQLDTLTRLITRSNNKTKELDLVNNNYNKKIQNAELVWDAARQVMIRKRVSR
jgi:predicted transcriptional regulator